MPIRDVFKFTRKTFINPTGWVDYDNLKTNTEALKSVLTSMFSYAKPTREETFEEAMQRLGLTEANVRSGIRVYRFIAIIFLLLSLLSFTYASYLLIYHRTFAGLLLGVSASALFLGQAFKYDFWSFQMRIRKLGATATEWKNSYFGGKGTSS